jgi:hypothetical protein
MDLKEIEVRVGLTLNLGNYESARVDVGAKATLDPQEDHRPAYKKLMDICALEIKDETAKINSQLAERYRSARS